MYIGLHVEYPLFLSDFNENLNFLDRFSKNPQMSNIMKIRPVGIKLFQGDGRMDVRTYGRTDGCTDLRTDGQT